MINFSAKFCFDFIRSFNRINSDHRQNAENFTLVWFDAANSENKRDKNQSIIIEQFPHILNVDTCIDYVIDVKYEFIFLIITDSPNIPDDFGQVLNQFTNIHSIFIFRNNDTNNQHESWSIKHHKLRGIFSSIPTNCA